MEKLICPKCGNELKLDEKTGYAKCEACNLSVKVADKIIKHNAEINKNEHIVDEARIKEAEVSLKKEELRIQREREKEERKDSEKKKKIIISACLIVIGVVLTLISLITTKGGFEEMGATGYLILPGVTGIIIGIVVLTSLKKKSKNKKKK